MTLTPNTSRRPTQPTIERPETPPRVRDKLVEGELLYAHLAGRVDVVTAKQDALAEGQRALRQDVGELREALREHERANAERDREMRAEMRAAREGADAFRQDMDARLDRMEQIMSARVGQGGQSGEVTQPLQSPLTSTGQGRRAAAVGGGGIGLATILGAIGALGSLPPALQWALIGLAVVAGLGAVAVAVRWGWRAAGR